MLLIQVYQWFEARIIVKFQKKSTGNSTSADLIVSSIPTHSVNKLEGISHAFLLAIISISTSAPNGNANTATHVLAGKGSLKYV